MSILSELYFVQKPIRYLILNGRIIQLGISQQSLKYRYIVKNISLSIKMSIDMAIRGTLTNMLCAKTESY